MAKQLRPEVAERVRIINAAARVAVRRGAPLSDTATNAWNRLRSMNQDMVALGFLTDEARDLLGAGRVLNPAVKSLVEIINKAAETSVCLDTRAQNAWTRLQAMNNSGDVRLFLSQKAKAILDI